MCLMNMSFCLLFMGLARYYFVSIEDINQEIITACFAVRRILLCHIGLCYKDFTVTIITQLFSTRFQFYRTLVLSHLHLRHVNANVSHA